jgi:hypothetical protein
MFHHAQLICWDGEGLANFSPGWSQTMILPVSTSWVARTTVCATTPNLNIFLIIYFHCIL